MKPTAKKVAAERRKYPRYNTDMEVYFKIKYDTQMRVEFHVMRSHSDSSINRRYFGICHNVGAEGLYIESKKELSEGDNLLIEVYEPIIRKPIKMEGRVRWCRKCPKTDAKEDLFGVGVQIASVGGKPLPDSIYFDKKYLVMWSILLESLFGSFAGVKKHSESTRHHK